MNKAWLYSSLLGIATLTVVSAHSLLNRPKYQFLQGAQQLGTARVLTKNNVPTQVECFTLHEPFSEAWSRAETELCALGWKLSGRSTVSQTFDWKGKCQISICPGKADKDLDFIDGTDETDTYVVIRTRAG